MKTDHTLPSALEDIHAKVLLVVQEVNQFQKEAFTGEVEVSFKNDLDLGSSILTATDVKTDRFLRDKLGDLFPEFGFVTEEEESGVPTTEYFWVIDPIDGTANFAAKIPLFGSSIALWGPQGPIYGIISFPLLGDTLYALKGKGAYCNGLSLSKERMLGTKENYFVGYVGDMDTLLRQLEKIKDEISFPFNYRCAIYHFAQVILGKFAGNISLNYAAWDIAAGLIIAEEAGFTNVFITPFPNPQSPKFPSYSHQVVTARKETAERIAQLLR